MEPSIYSFSLCTALPLMLFFGFYFLFAKKRNGDADRDQIRQPGSMCGNLTHHPVYPIDVEHCLKAKQAGQMPHADHKMQNHSQ